LRLRSLLVHLSSTVSSPVSATPSLVLTHGLSEEIIHGEKRRMNRHDCRQWVCRLVQQQICKVGAPMKWACEPALHLEEFYGGYDMLVSFSRSMLEGHPNASVL
jgi:hypothetical protein